MKRFWAKTAVLKDGAGFAITLDDRPLRTPAKAALHLPTQALAQAIAAEWDGQGDEVRPDEMPLTRAANTTIDRVTTHFDEVSGTISAYGETDLICYRAPHPAALAERQATAWDPLLEWAAERLSARLAVAEGVMFTAQNNEALDALAQAVRAHTPWELTALHDLVTLSGSLVIGLGVSHGRLEPEAAWRTSRVDEQWNIEEWGEDEEAARLAALKQADFMTASRLLGLVRSG